MPGLFRSCLSVFVVVAVCQGIGSQRLRPNISPTVDTIIKDQGDSLEIECSSSSKIHFVYPVNDTDLITSEPEIQEYYEHGEYRYVFRRSKTVYGDTGWYACADEDVEISSFSYDDPDVAAVYVYVRSNANLFVENTTFASLRGVTGGNVTIPCRPTWPDLNVTLTKDDDIVPEDKAVFDPRFGFKMKNLVVKDSGQLKCSAELGNVTDGVDYHLSVIRRHTLTEPRIIETPLRHVTRGQILRVNCTIDVEVDILYVLKWNTPQTSSRITTRQYREMIGSLTRRATVELIINNVKDEDEGEYECVISSPYDSKSSKKYITVYDPDIKYINLTSQDSIRHYERYEGQKVQWVVNVDGFPQPDIRWFDPKGKQITSTWDNPSSTKYAINLTPSVTILRINRLNINDMGIYSVQALNEERVESLNFTLDVMDKPDVFLSKIEPYYAPKQIAEVYCDVAAFPTPNITWIYQKCPNYPSCQDSKIEVLKNSTENSDKSPIFVSKVFMTVEMSGHLTCRACNELGCGSTTENIFVSDVKNGFDIIAPTEPVAEGDDVNIICGASIYNYSNVMYWVDEDERQLQATDRLKIIPEKTQFTYRLILRIENVRKSDSMRYMCIVRTADSSENSNQSMTYDLKINDPVAPYFTETNMNGTETSVDVNTDGHKSIELNCFADGMPKPKVTWYKDNVMLTNNDQRQLYHNNQTLRLTYLLERDSGKYECRAENRIGKKEAYQIFTVKGKELPKGWFILIGVLLVIVIILVVYFTIKIRREKIMRKELMEAGLMHFEEGALECLNPELTVDDQAELLPYDKKWEFPRERLKLGKQLGSGAFGVVMKAEAQGICEDEAVTTVAVKMVRRTTDPTYVRALASELKIMVHLGKHLNVVNLLGACTKNISKRELLVIVEYCRFGNLHNYLLRHRSNFINQIDPTTGKYDPTIGSDILTRTASVSSNNSLSANSGADSVHYQGTGTDSQGVSMSPDGCIVSNNSSQPGWRSNYRGDYKDHNLKPISTQDLLSWAFQVAQGMEYLSQRRVLHGDLAARNILLAENNIVKICDFGLAKNMYKDNNYKKKGDGPLPIKWMAIESIRDRVFSTQSDIWSFGIVLWEFFTLAETPYPGMEAEKQYQKLIEGYRMEQPEYATAEVYDIMLQCWKAKPTLRPSFSELVENIGDLLEESVRTHYVSLNAPYIDMNTMMLESGKNDYLTMMSAPDHTALSSPNHEYVNSPGSPPASEYLCMSPSSQKDESGIFSPRPLQGKTHFEFPSPTSDSEDAVELSPMLKKEEDPYLKPINVHERRAEFARQRQALKNQLTNERSMDRDSGYCNAPRNLHLIDLNNVNEKEETGEDKVDSKETDFVSPIIRTQDNYVNMPKQKSELMKDMPASFSNPSYVMMGNREVDQTKV